MHEGFTQRSPCMRSVCTINSRAMQVKLQEAPGTPLQGKPETHMNKTFQSLRALRPPSFSAFCSGTGLGVTNTQVPGRWGWSLAPHSLQGVVTGRHGVQDRGLQVQVSASWEQASCVIQQLSPSPGFHKLTHQMGIVSTRSHQLRSFLGEVYTRPC
jgi:hypothetical protein